MIELGSPSRQPSTHLRPSLATDRCILHCLRDKINPPTEPIGYSHESMDGRVKESLDRYELRTAAEIRAT